MNLPDSKEARASRLARLALFVWLAPLNVNFRMEYFSVKNGFVIKPHEIKNECGTSCCFVGHAPFILDTTSLRYDAQFWNIISDEFLISGSKDEWDFLFNEVHEDDRKLAAYRAYLNIHTGIHNPTRMYEIYDSLLDDTDYLEEEDLLSKYPMFQDDALKTNLMSYLIPDDGTNGWMPGDPVP